MSGLTNLRYLDLGKTFLDKLPVRDLEPLKGLTNLAELRLIGCDSEKNIDALKGIKN